MAKNNQNTIVVDAKGLSCPLPLLRLKKALNLAKQPVIIKLLATDNNTKNDVDSLCKHFKYPMQLIEKENYFEISVEKR